MAAVASSAAPHLTVRSAGTEARAGRRPVGPVVTELAAREIAANGQGARQLRRRVVTQARLIITATRAHRVAVARLDDQAGDRTFTLIELSRLLTSNGDTVLRGGIDAVLVHARNAVAAEPPLDFEDDLADPVGLGSEDYGRMFAEVDVAMSVLLQALAN